MLTFVASRANNVRRCAVAATVLVLLLSLAVAFAGRARADSSATLVSMANNARASAGLAPLTVNGDLAGVARAQADRMAASGVLSHTPNLAGAVCCWVNLGENVGEASTVALLQHAFMTSPEHRANILSTKYTEIGVGVAVDSKGMIWVSEVFRRPSAPAPAPAPTQQPRVTQPAVTSPATVQPQAPSATQRKSATAPPPTTAAPVPASAPRPHTSATTTNRGGRASRDLASGRLPLDQARRMATALAFSSTAPPPDPVSGLLNFAATVSTTD